MSMTNDSPTPLERESIATSLGRLLEGQGNMKDDVAEIKGGMKSTIDQVTQHAVTLGEHELRLSAHDDRFKEMQPIRNSWLTVVAVIIAALGLVVSAVETWALTHK